MKLIAAIVAFAGLSGLLSGPATALNSRTWISGKGVDQAGCGPVATPCRTLQYAHDQTSAGGEIDVLDPAGYGSVYITKAINIINEGVGVAGVLASAGSDAITIFAPSTADVVLRGLTIEGTGVGRGGVVLLRTGSLTIDNCLVQNFVGTNDGAGNGIRIAPSSGAPFVIVKNTTVANNGYVGLYLKPQGGSLANAVIDHVTAIRNQYGISVTTTSDTGIAQVSITNSLVAGNSVRGVEHIYDDSGSYSSELLLDRVVAVKNGTNVYLRGSTSKTTLNNNSLQDLQVVSGYVTTYGNNAIDHTSFTGFTQKASR